MTTSPRLLLVEDDFRLRHDLEQHLLQRGFAVTSCVDGIQGLRALQGERYDLVLLDIMLPKLDGISVLRQIRAEGIQTPVLMLTAKSDLVDRVHGLDLGADYYLTKPFENAEFLACLRAILRRQGDITPESLHFGDLTLTPSRGALRCREQVLTLSARELEMMRLLMLNQNAILPKETLLVKVWGYDTDAGDNNVEAYISFLRKKLQLLRSTVTLNVVRRLGYRLEENKP